MALSFLRKAEQEPNFPSVAISISSKHSVLNEVDEQIINSSMYKSSGSNLFGSRATRTPSQDIMQEESASTESGDDDFSSVHSVSFTSKDSEVGDDEKSLSPRSAPNDAHDAASCVYSVMLLFNLRAACCARAERRSLLGYRTEPVPESSSSKSPFKAPSASKQRAKAPKARGAGAEYDRLPKASLPTSTADSWVAKHHTTGTCDDAKVIRAARSILNKLTLEKFESLFDQLVACGIETPYHVSTLMCEVFEKATTQHAFIPMYAELCGRLEKDPQIAYAVRRAGDQQNFRRLLLDHCQETFEQLLVPCPEEAATDEEAQIRRKQQALGSVKFVGELLVQGMLGSALFVQCSNSLLQSRTTCPEALESLAALMMVAGPKFDTKEWSHHASLEEIFSSMKDLTKDKSTPPRIRFLLRDVLDVRSAGWCTSANQAAVKTAPMKLEEVREKAAEEQGVVSPKRQIKNLPSRSSIVESFRGAPAGSAMRGNDDSKVKDKGKNPRAKGRAALKEEIAATRKSCAEGSQKQSHKSGLSGNDVASVCRKMFGRGRQDTKTTASEDDIIEIEAKLEPVTYKNDCLVEVPVPRLFAMVKTRIVEDFDIISFHHALSSTLTKLALDKNVPAAVQYIRLQEVPVQFQADEFADILSRILEEKRGAIRRCSLAFAAGLMATEQSPFDRMACLEGVGVFFHDVYVELCCEVPRLPAIVKSELLPTMHGVYTVAELNTVLPEELRT